MGASTRRATLGALAAAPLIASGGPVTQALAATQEAAVSDLAQACIWAGNHLGHVNANSWRPEWTDSVIRDELERADAVVHRAINEPSASLQDIRAKAGLALREYEDQLFPRRGVEPVELDAGERLILTVLLEIVGLGPRIAGA